MECGGSPPLLTPTVLETKQCACTRVSRASKDRSLNLGGAFCKAIANASVITL